MYYYKIAGLITVTSIPVLLTIKHLLNKRHKKRLKAIQQLSNNFYYHCLFLTPQKECRQHIIHNSSCSEDCSNEFVSKMRKFISSAKISISFCMYHFTIRQIGDELVKAHKRGVKIRLLGDKVTSSIQHSQMQYLKNRYRIEFRIPRGDNSFMHHKFGVIDVEDSESAKVFFGSLNLTTQGFSSNYEFVVLTNNPLIIDTYGREFETLWQEFASVFD